ncbi:putative holliday junction resolvase [Acetoanaerobium noterae]|jgi:putative holliday junction resolvase|uniref:Putative pre-16S rRNA nuclease n=1 Tax=Acetoanaerobium noterae TaxID=745369 RepID=A0A1T4ZS93_9FIRM|nr:Holliday junction resolvase RuvX [Acetoanaerobium noterae]MBP8763126.1 Holliday junction resolvase RuvX [Acetoanaerobium sp.]MBP9499456.1 Holliday junction resolvase RuvX [Acetoanaerobium sp.]MBP9562334.1 Holliday junction resolvase RuvX [Acetoanaerobium sp.]SKB25213.1 putative holliday junction resolvase [Acetoanaerobium noterae]
MRRILGLDIGDKRIGIAVSDLLGMMAQPLYTLTRKSTKDAINEIAEIIQKEDIKQVVVGLPKNMDSTEGIQAKRTRDFSQLLLEKTNSNIEIIYCDERLTSKMAKQSLSHMKLAKAKEKKLIDTAAAVHILQGYLDSKK